MPPRTSPQGVGCEYTALCTATYNITRPVHPWIASTVGSKPPKAANKWGLATVIVFCGQKLRYSAPSRTAMRLWRGSVGKSLPHDPASARKAGDQTYTRVNESLQKFFPARDGLLGKAIGL